MKSSQMSLIVSSPSQVTSARYITASPSSRPSSVMPRQANEMGKRLSVGMPHYVAIIEESGSTRAVGIWFPDLPGCFSAGDDLDEALRNAPEAISLYADSLAEEGRKLPSPRSLTELRRDPVVAEDLKNYMVALVT